MAPPTQPSAPQALALPRSLILFASAWLMASWLLAVGALPPIEPSTLIYEPSARLMIALIVLGGTIAWPLLRLSGQRQRRPIAAVLLDLISLVVLVQIVLWPLRLMTNWTAERTALIDCEVVGWMAIVAALLAISTSRGALVRTAVMVVLVGWVIAPLAIYGPASPVGAIWEVTSGGGSLVLHGSWTTAACWWVVAALLWGVVGVLSVTRGGEDRTSEIA